MSGAKTGAAKLMGLMLVGGLMTGGLLAMTTPTQMKREATNWRQAIGVRDVAVAESTIPVYAPPEDLTPVHWQPASSEYAYASTPEPWVDTTTDLMPDAADDTEVQIGTEHSPAEITADRSSQPALDDTAATAAQAAQATASDVREVEHTTSVASTANPASAVSTGTT